MSSPASRLRMLLVVSLVAVSSFAVASPPVAAQSTAEPAFVVELNSDGSANVTIRSQFDLTTDAEQTAFRSLETDEQAQADAMARLLDRIRAVASDAEDATGREMRVVDVSIDLRRTADNRTGVVTLTVTWEGLAARSNGSLRLSEPFASGFEPDRRFVVRAPDGYAIARSSPDPDSLTQTSAEWEADTPLDGFEVVLEPVDQSATETGTKSPIDTSGQPGFGIVAGLLALLGFAGLNRWIL